MFRTFHDFTETIESEGQLIDPEILEHPSATSRPVPEILDRRASGRPHSGLFAATPDCNGFRPAKLAPDEMTRLGGQPRIEYTVISTVIPSIILVAASKGFRFVVTLGVLCFQ